MYFGRLHDCFVVFFMVLFVVVLLDVFVVVFVVVIINICLFLGIQSLTRCLHSLPFKIVVPSGKKRDFYAVSAHFGCFFLVSRNSLIEKYLAKRNVLF